MVTPAFFADLVEVGFQGTPPKTGKRRGLGSGWLISGLWEMESTLRYKRKGFPKTILFI